MGDARRATALIGGWLIDQVVYRLYGLTEEEIRIVEGMLR